MYHSFFLLCRKDPQYFLPHTHRLRIDGFLLGHTPFHIAVIRLYRNSKKKAISRCCFPEWIIRMIQFEKQARVSKSPMKKRAGGECLENGLLATHSQSPFVRIAFGWSQCCKILITGLIIIIMSYQFFPVLFLCLQDDAQLIRLHSLRFVLVLEWEGPKGASGDD